jgi:hypothetical protein
MKKFKNKITFLLVIMIYILIGTNAVTDDLIASNIPVTGFPPTMEFSKGNKTNITGVILNKVLLWPFIDDASYRCNFTLCSR